MGSLAIAVLVFTTIDKMKYSIILLVFGYIAYVQAGAWVYVDDADYAEHLRVRRSPQEELRRAGPAPLPYAPAPGYAEDLPVSASASYGKGHKGRVGPVYTFVKTDPKANFKGSPSHRWISIRKIDET